MLISVSQDFAFIPTPKCASTSIEAALHPHAQIITGGHPKIKHTTFAEFERFILPYLKSKNLPIEWDRFVVVALFREPVDWLYSWYRFRSRDELADPKHPNHFNYAGNLTFEDFVLAHFADEYPARFLDQSDYVLDNAGEVGPAKLYRYEDMEHLVALLRARIGDFELEWLNVSPQTDDHFDCQAVGRRYRAELAKEYRIYDGIRS